ncbi:MAG: cache domain-containing protein, partial [Desulfovibrionales bacterium]|nr:cache domain-containing protein [Desulfovibrionales bacterium]
MIGLMHTSLYRLQILRKRLARFALSPFGLIKHFPIRYKLLIIYSTCFFITISLAAPLIYVIMEKNLEESIETQLDNSTQAIVNTVKTAVSVSIKTRLRAIAEKNTDIVHHLHNRYLKEEISLETAQTMAVDALLCQGIGDTGYVCILTGQGRVVHHPKPPLEGRDISHHDFIKEMAGKSQGYIEYHWQNPKDTTPRPKALYFKYFKPWDWKVTAAAYREEFSKLVNINDFKDGILNLRFGKTGYSYVIDIQGNVIIHPELSGTNVLTDSRYPSQFFKRMKKMKSGKFIYPWQAPGEIRARDKLVRFSFIPEYQWIVGSSSYLDEYYAPLRSIKKVIFIAGIIALIVFIPISFFLSATITNPIRSLTERFNRDIGDGFSNHFLKMESRDEVGQLTFYYNSFMDKLNAYDRDLKAEIKERRHIQEALSESEEKYRSVMEAVPDPIVVYDMDGQVTYMNPAFTQVFGYTLQDCFGHRMDHFIPRAHWKESMESIESILQGSILPPMETQRKAKDGRLIDVTTRGSVYRNKLGRPMGSVITHRDISEVKRLEKAIMETGERE